MPKQLHPFYFPVGGKFLVRPIQASDKVFIQEGFDHLSESSRYTRFFGAQRKLTDYMLKYLTEVDGVNHVSWGILDETHEPVGVGIGRFVRLKDDPKIAETAITVTDAYQRQGFGLLLFSVLNIAAAAAGIEIFRYYILRSNQFVIESLSHMNAIKTVFEDDVVIMDIAVHASHQTIPDMPGSQKIIATMKQVESLIF